MIWDAISSTIGVLMGSSLGERRNARKRQELEAEGRVQLAVRAQGTRARGLTSTWNSGFWTVAPHRVTLYSISIPIDRIISVREVELRETLKIDGVDPECVVLEVESGSGSVEIAVMKDQLDWFAREVGVPVGD